MKKENTKVNVKKDNKNTKDKFKKGLEKIDQNRNLVFSFIGGALVVALITVIIWPDRIATLKDGTQPVVKVNGETITADFLYEEMKKNYSISYLIEYIDKAILDKKYEEINRNLLCFNAFLWMFSWRRYDEYANEKNGRILIEISNIRW